MNKALLEIIKQINHLALICLNVLFTSKIKLTKLINSIRIFELVEKVLPYPQHLPTRHPTRDPQMSSLRDQALMPIFRIRGLPVVLKVRACRECAILFPYT